MSGRCADTVTDVSVPTRWTANAVIQWTPILTFTRRRMAVLDWFEENVKPVAFTDNPDHAGIAVETPHQRLRFDRQRLRLSTDDHNASIQPLGHALEGLWTTVQPHNAVFRRYNAAWTYPVSRDYEMARKALTDRCLVADFAPRATAFDAAVLIDLKTDTGKYQFEFGIVTASELVERLAEPDLGLMGTTDEDRPPIKVAKETLAPVSAFFDVRGEFRARLGSPQDALSMYQAVEQEVSRLVTAVGATL